MLLLLLLLLPQVLRKRTCKLLPSEVDQYLRYLMFTVESAVRNMKNGAEQWVFVIDLNSKYLVTATLLF